MRAYRVPSNWWIYDRDAVRRPLAEARAAAGHLLALPLSRDWAEPLSAQARGATLAGLVRLTGEAASEAGPAEAARTGRPFEGGASPDPGALWDWIEAEAPAAPLGPLALRRILSAAEADARPAGAPRPRPVLGAVGDAGAAFRAAFDGLTLAVANPPPGLDPLLLALAAHYHFGAIHPFRAWNGRAAVAIEAYGLARLGLRGPRALAMPDRYAARRGAYDDAVEASQARGHDMTPFLVFALQAVADAAGARAEAIARRIRLALVRARVAALFERLADRRRQALAGRVLAAVDALSSRGPMPAAELRRWLDASYRGLAAADAAFLRDMALLEALGLIAKGGASDPLALDADWAERVSDDDFKAALADPGRPDPARFDPRTERRRAQAARRNAA